MEFRLLRYFLAVAEELHFGRAAQRLHISQPPLSQQIMKLEDELGVQLFIRTKRNVSLTEAGKSLEHYAIKILSLIETAQRDVREVAAGMRGFMSLGYVGPAMDGVLPDIIRRFKRRYPEVELRLRQMTSNEQLAEIRNGSLHAGIVRLSGQDMRNLDTIPIHQETYVLAVPSEHHMAREKGVSICALANKPLIFFARKLQPGLYEEWHRIFLQEDLVPDIVQETTSYHSSIALVSAGLGIAIVPESSARHKRKGVRFVKLNGKKPKMILHLCYPETSIHPVLNSFKTVIQGKE